MTRYRRKPEPPGGVIDIAEYQPGQPLDDLEAVAAMARGQIAECELPAGTVLVVRWVDYSDTYPAKVEFEVLDQGEYLVYSPDHDTLATFDAETLDRYEPVPDETPR